MAPYSSFIVRLCSAGLVRFNDRTEMKEMGRSGAELQKVRAQLEEHKQEDQRLNQRLVKLETIKATEEMASGAMDALSLGKEDESVATSSLPNASPADGEETQQ